MKNHVMGLFTVLALSAIAVHANDVAKPKGPEEDGTLPALVRIAGEGTMDSHAFEYLTELSDQVGARVTGTPNGQRSIDWGLAKMKAIGLKNVRAEKWSMWKGWTRGKAEAELLAPIRHPLTIDAMGWTGSTPPQRCRSRSRHRQSFRSRRRNPQCRQVPRENRPDVAEGQAKEKFRRHLCPIR
jgi:hypothetical protein